MLRLLPWMDRSYNSYLATSSVSLTSAPAVQVSDDLNNRNRNKRLFLSISQILLLNDFNFRKDFSPKSRYLI